jgi:hypothetical protein
MDELAAKADVVLTGAGRIGMQAPQEASERLSIEIKWRAAGQWGPLVGDYSKAPPGVSTRRGIAALRLQASQELCRAFDPKPISKG